MLSHHIQMLEKLKQDIERLARGAVFHAEDLEDIDNTEADINHHNEAIGRHLKAMRQIITDFGNNL